MAQYLVLIYTDPKAMHAAPPEIWTELHEGHNQFGTKHTAVTRGGNALQSADTATSLRTDSAGAVTVTDGAFAESKEELAGYYLIEAADLDEAIAISSDVPAPFGGVEIRPLMVFE